MPSLETRLFIRIFAKGREVYWLKIVTLAIAFACSTLVILFSFHEFGYDRFHRDYEAVFRLLQRNNQEQYSGNRLSSRIPPDAYSELKSRPSDSLMVARIKVMDALSVRVNGQFFHDQKLHAADPELADIFQFRIVDGSMDEFFRKEQTILLSLTTAVQYFGDQGAAGKTIEICSFGDTVRYSVAAVYQDFPENAHEEFSQVIRFDPSMIRTLKFDFRHSGVYGRVSHGKLDHQEALFNNQLRPSDFTYRFQPIAEIYFGPRVIGEDARHGDRYSMIILVCITALILFLALSNFINLTTLTLPHRSKELAVKKLSGHNQWNVLMTFAKESFLVVGISLGLGMLMLVLTLPVIEPMLSFDIQSFLSEGDIGMMAVILAIFLITGMAPLFLAIRFARATPTRLLSTDTITFPQFKRVITFLQLGISIFLMAASLVVKRQIDYSLLKEPGRNHDQVVYMGYPRGLAPENLNLLRIRWKEDKTTILDVIPTSHLPDQVSSKELGSGIYTVSVDPGYKDFFGLQMTQGVWFGVNTGDSMFVVNQSGMKRLGKDTANVLGVFEDTGGQFNQPEKPIKLTVSRYANYNFLFVRVMEVDIRNTVRYLASSFGRENQVKISFLNRRFEGWLAYQDRLNSLSNILAIISGLLSCCAIYGLSVSLVRDKLRQIAIHKLWGASTMNITQLLVREFARQMAMAILIFGPLTYIIIKEILGSFVYSTHLTWLDTLVPLAYCVAVILLLCGFQAMSLRRQNLSVALKG